MIVVFLSPPGGGKGTQAPRLARQIGAEHLSTGVIFRSMYEANDPLGIKAHDEYWGKGQLCPDGITIPLVEKKLAELEGAVLDGFPRNIAQAEALDRMVKVDAVVSLSITEQTALERLGYRAECKACNITYGLANKPLNKGECNSCHGQLNMRNDDADAAIIRQRFEQYETKTKLLLEYYRKNGNLHEIDGNQDPERVYVDILRALRLDA